MKKILIILVMIFFTITFVSCGKEENKLKVNDLLEDYNYSSEVTYEYINLKSLYLMKNRLFSEFVEELNNYSEVKKIDFKEEDLPQEYVKLSSDNMIFYIMKDGSLVIKKDAYYSTCENIYNFNDFANIVDYKNFYAEGKTVDAFTFARGFSYSNNIQNKYESKSHFQNAYYFDYIINRLNFSIDVIKLPYVTYKDNEKRIEIYSEYNDKYYFREVYPSIYLKLSDYNHPYSYFISENEALIRYGDDYYLALEPIDNLLFEELIDLSDGNLDTVNEEIDRLWNEYQSTID